MSNDNSQIGSAQFAEVLRSTLGNQKTVLRLFDHLYRYAVEEPDPEKLKFREVYPAVYPDKNYAHALKEKGTGDFFRIATALRKGIDKLQHSPVGKRLPATCRFPVAKIHDGRYRMNFDPAAPSLKRFWWPYLDDKSESGRTRPWLALYTENVFFRPRLHSDLFGRYFIRHLDVNSDESNILKDCKFLKNDGDAKRFESCRHFVSSGDVRFLLGLCQWFERMGLQTKFQAASDRSFSLAPHEYHQTWQQFDGHNLILTGNPRTFPFIESYLAREDFRYRIDSLGTVDTKYPDPKSTDQDLQATRDAVRGILNRTRLEGHDIWVTAILSNHARFIEAVLQLLTTEEGMKNVLDHWIPGGSKDGPLKTRFEIHLEMRSPQDNNPLRKYDLRRVPEPVVRREKA